MHSANATTLATMTRHAASVIGTGAAAAAAAAAAAPAAAAPAAATPAAAAPAASPDCSP